MISLQSINNSIVPNVYVKKVVLDSDSVASENVGNVLLSVKLKKSTNTTDDLEKLLNSELKQYLKFHVHFITDEDTYKQIIETPDSEVLSSTDGQSKVYQVDDFQINNNSETVLENGQTLMELTKNVTFSFKEQDSFLAVIATAMIKHPNLTQAFLGDVTGDIVLYNNQVQTEGMVFKIAPFPSADPVSTEVAQQVYKKFGAPGEIWAGGVHLHNNLFMAGPKHSEQRHPYLDYEMVSINKYQDNRIKKKIEREIINITEITTKLRSLTKFTSATNNLLFDKEKHDAYISDIFLSQDKELDVQGTFLIDKNNIVKGECAMPFLFTNIKNKYKSTQQQKAVTDSLLNQANLLFLNIYEGNNLLGTLTSDNENGAIFRERAPDPRQTKGRPKATLVLKIDKEDFKANEIDGVMSYVFKRHFRTPSDNNTLEYRISVEYSDPTIPYVKSIVPFITSAIEQINQIVKEAETFNAFDPHTNKLKSWFTKHLKENTSDYNESLTVPISVVNLLKLPQFNVFFHSPLVKMLEMRGYFYSLVNIEDATIDSFLTASKFLIDLRTRIETALRNFGSKPKNDSTGNNFSAHQSAIDSKSSFTNPTLKAEKSSSIRLSQVGYDFIGSVKNGNTDSITTITNLDYIENTLSLVQQMVKSTETVVLDTIYGAPLFTMSGGTPEAISDSAFSFLNLPTTRLRDGVVLPETVIDFKKPDLSVEEVFGSLVQYNSEIFEKFKGSAGDPSQRSKLNKQLTSIMGITYDTTLIGGTLDIVAKQTTKMDGSTLSRTEDKENRLGGKNQRIKANKSLPEALSSFLSNKDANVVEDSNNFVLSALTNKLQSNSRLVTKSIYPKSDNAPLQVKMLSLEESGILKDFNGDDSFYINQGVINPAFMCYYWFIHQNLVKVEYFRGFQTINDLNTNSIVRSVNYMDWTTLTLQDLVSLKQDQKLFCKLTRYTGAGVDTELLGKLNLPLLNNYFIMEGVG